MHISDKKADCFRTNQKVIAQRMAQHGVPGCSMALIQDGKITFSYTCGIRNRNSAPVTGETLFECASLTKPLFAVLALQMADKGLLSPDEPVARQLGGVPWSNDSRFGAITPRHILSHGSGLPDWHSRPMPMLFEPGNAYSYSGEGYYLLQHLVEKITGKALPELFDQYVFAPFEMKHSAVIWTPAVGNAISEGYDANGNVCRVRDAIDLTGNAPEPNAAWSLYSCASDYAQFICSLLRCRGRLSKNTYEQMTTVQNLADVNIAWGLGVGIVRSAPDVLWHWGDNDGFKSFSIWDKSTGDGLVVITNSDNGLSLCYDLTAELTDIDFLGNIAAFIETAE